MNNRERTVDKIRRHYESYLQGERGVDIDEILYYLGALIDAYDEQGAELDLCKDENANHVVDVERLRSALDECSKLLNKHIEPASQNVLSNKEVSTERDKPNKRTTSEHIDEAFEWLESHMNRHVAVIEVRLVNALLRHIEEARQDDMSKERGKEES